jgi:hypothetical protein
MPGQFEQLMGNASFFEPAGNDAGPIADSDEVAR